MGHAIKVMFYDTILFVIKMYPQSKFNHFSDFLLVLCIVSMIRYDTYRRYIDTIHDTYRDTYRINY